MEYWEGEIKQIASNEDKEIYCKEKMVGKELPDYMSSWCEFYCDENYNEIIDTDYGLFKNYAKPYEPDDGKCELTKTGEDTFKIHMIFYNGGADLSEMIQDGLSKL
jgi:hypothetical protein